MMNALSRCLGCDTASWPVTPKQMADALREEIGGDFIYVPAVGKAERNQIIRSKFNGRNLRELGKEFNLSVRQIQNIVNPRTERRPGRG